MATLQNALNRSVNKNQLAMQRINILASNETRSVLTTALDMTFNEQASFVRTVFPTIVTKYGNISAVSGMHHYDEMRSLRDIPGAVFEAKLPSLNYIEKIDKTLGYAISRNYNDGIEAMARLLIDEVTLYVSDYNRDTISFNASNDKQVVSVQRVAEADACAFCMTIALNQYTFAVDGNSGLDVTDFQDEYHANCQCSVEAIYENEPPIRPDYYDNFQNIYDAARENITSPDSKATFAEIRKIANNG